jgi:hypothetical protein
MDETTLRARLEDATAPEPPTDRPIGRIIAESRRAGGRRRRRRLISSTTASVAGVAVIATAASLASGALGHARHPGPANHFGPPGQMAYVLTLSGDVVPINLATMKAGPPLLTGLNPGWMHGQGITGPDIVAARGGRSLYVSTQAKPKILGCHTDHVVVLGKHRSYRDCRARARGVILQVSTATGRIERRIRVAAELGFPDDLVSTPNGKVGYAMAIGLGYLKPSAKLTPIDLMTGTKLRQMSMPFSAMNQSAVSLNSRTLLVAGELSFPTERVDTVNVAAEHADKPVDIKDADDTCLAVSPDGGTGYVAVTNKKPAEVVPIDVSAGMPLKAITLPSVRYSNREVPFCSMAVAPNGRTAYVVMDRYLMPIDLVTRRALRPIELPAGLSSNPEEPTLPGTPLIAIAPNGRMAYALTREGVTPIDLATSTPLPTISLGKLHRQCLPVPSRTRRKFSIHCGNVIEGGGTSLSFSPNGMTVLVGVSDNYVLPIQAATGKPGKAIRVPGGPVAIVTP